MKLKLKLFLHNTMTFKNFVQIVSSSGKFSISDFKNKRIAIDASIKLIQAMRGMEYGQHLMGPNGELTSHIRTLLSNIVEFEKNKIDQIWIFDSSKRKVYKSKEHIRRDEIKDKNKKHIDELELRINMIECKNDTLYIEDIDTPPGSDDENNTELLTKLKRELVVAQTASLGNFPQAVADLKYMLNMLGIKYIIAPDNVEAEQVGSVLASYNMIDYFITTDPDYLLFSAGLLIENNKAYMSPSPFQFKMLKKVPKTQKYDLYELDSMLKDLDVTPEEFIKIGICMGIDIISHKDYSSTSGIKGIGSKTVIDIVKGKKKNQNYQLQNYHIDAIDKFKYILPREAITIYPKIPLDNATMITNAKALENWLVIHKGFKMDRVIKNIKAIVNLDY